MLSVAGFFDLMERFLLGRRLFSGGRKPSFLTGEAGRDGLTLITVIVDGPLVG